MLLVNDNDSKQETPLSDELVFQTFPPSPWITDFGRKRQSLMLLFHF